MIAQLDLLLEDNLFKNEVIEVVDKNYVKKICKKLKVKNLDEYDFQDIANDVNEEITFNPNHGFSSNYDLLVDTIHSQSLYRKYS